MVVHHYILRRQTKCQLYSAKELWIWFQETKMDVDETSTDKLLNEAERLIDMAHKVAKSKSHSEFFPILYNIKNRATSSKN